VGLSGAFQPGGGGSTQVATDSVIAGIPCTVRLELSVWGAGGDIKGRYTDIALFYRLAGDSDYKMVSPQPVSHSEKQEVYNVTIPPFSDETHKEIEYYIEFKL